MFFVASKVFWFVIEPVNFLILLGLAGVVLAAWRFTRAGRLLTYCAIVALAVACFSPLGAVLLRPLEDRFPTPPANMPPPTGIIVLGGAIDGDLTAARGQPALLTAGTRLTSAVVLARRYPQARLIFTGGSASLTNDEISEAVAARQFWLDLGVPEERMSFEDRSRNTWENAIFTRDLLKPGPDDSWLLITSAWHTPRSVGIFRQAGFNVTPYPVDYHTFGDARDWKPTHVATDALIKLDFAVHEWIGLVAYRLTGKTDALFPAP
jgi:uncharacterized SAM-binding protein YcdF (DUF218 family)